MKKIKVAWICHFSNQDVRNRLPLSDYRLINMINKLIGKKNQLRHKDFAPWVNNLIKEFEKFEDIELHVIAPKYGLKQFNVKFEMNGVFYHFFKPDIPIIHVDLLSKIFKKPKYFMNRLFIKKNIQNIKPDIINLIGAENPYYSISALDIKNIPLYISCQTIYSNPNRSEMGDTVCQWRLDVELQIHNKAKYYGCTSRMHRDLLLKNNPNAIVFKMFFPIEKQKEIKPLPKKYDFVFFAGFAKKKGIEDTIDALYIVQKTKKDVILNIVGKASGKYLDYLNNKINDLKLKNNIIFSDYFPSHADMHKHITQSSFAVLPIKLDAIPSSIIEAIYLDIPVITYKTSGTPYLNRDGLAVLIAEMNNSEQLAQHMITLLESPKLANQLRRNARAFVEKEFDNTNSAKRLAMNYRAVIDHYYRNSPIPKELLFNTEEFPVY